MAEKQGFGSGATLDHRHRHRHRQSYQRLSVLYAKSEQKVAQAAKKRKDGAKDLALLARFAGQFPPSLAKIMAGEPCAENKGFQLIALQIAITANALDKKEDDVLALCEGLIANHASDGARYNTPQKRRNELSRMLRYTEDNPGYTYSRDAVRALLPKGTPATDLDGLPASAGEVMGQDTMPEDGGMRGGVFLTDTGIYRRTEEGVTQICDVAFKDPIVLTDAYTGYRVGFESEILVAGRSVGRKILEQQTFLSRAHFQKFAMAQMGGFRGTDNDLVAASTILRDTAMAKPRQYSRVGTTSGAELGRWWAPRKQGQQEAGSR